MIEAQGSGLVGFAVAIALNDPFAGVVEDGGFGDSDAIEVACQIAVGLFSGAHRFGVHDPVFFPYRWGDNRGFHHESPNPFTDIRSTMFRV